MIFWICNIFVLVKELLMIWRINLRNRVYKSGLNYFFKKKIIDFWFTCFLFVVFCLLFFLYLLVWARSPYRSLLNKKQVNQKKKRKSWITNDWSLKFSFVFNEQVTFVIKFKNVRNKIVLVSPKLHQSFPIWLMKLIIISLWKLL